MRSIFEIFYRNLILGGYNGVARLSSVEKYNPVLDNWSLVRPMNSARSNFATTILDGMIFAVGGFNGISVIDRNECYDLANNLW